MTPYYIVYSQQPPSSISYLSGNSKVHAVDNLLQSHYFTLVALKDNLVMAQNCMKQQVDQHHSDRAVEEGDHVFLCL